MQSAQLSREHELRCRDLMILRYDRQRQLCDEIITKQRILIDGNVFANFTILFHWIPESTDFPFNYDIVVNIL